MEYPQPYTGTDPRGMEVWIDLVRKMTPGERLGYVFVLIERERQSVENDVRSLYPCADDREVLLRVVARRLTRDLVIRAYGYDPEVPDDSIQPYSLRHALAEGRWERNKTPR